MAFTKPKALYFVCLLALLQGCSNPPHDFTTEIAECRAMDDVTLIGQGTFKKSTKGSITYFYFEFDEVHFGNFSGVDGKTGKKIQMTKTPVKEENVPVNSLGKEALGCFGGNAMPAVYFANPS